MAGRTPRAAERTEQRPTPVLIVYCWDVLLAILAIFAAMAALGGEVAVGARLVTVPAALQWLDALASAVYAAVLITMASLLTRPQAWIRRTQIATLAIAMALTALSLVLAATTGGLGTVPLLVSILFMLLDLLALVVMTERRIAAWYAEPGRTPRPVIAALAFWSATSVALLISAALV